MFELPLKYNNFADEEVEETFYFHLSKADAIQMAADGFADKLDAIVKGKITDNAQIVQGFKRLVLAAYGKKSEDGKRFVKNPQDRLEFEESDAFGEILMKLATDPEFAGQFFNSLFSKSTMTEINAMASDPAQDQRVAAESTPVATPESGPKIITRAEAAVMDGDELRYKLLNGWTIEEQQLNMTP